MGPELELLHQAIDIVDGFHAIGSIVRSQSVRTHEASRMAPVCLDPVQLFRGEVDIGDVRHWVVPEVSRNQIPGVLTSIVRIAYAAAVFVFVFGGIIIRSHDSSEDLASLRTLLPVMDTETVNAEEPKFTPVVAFEKFLFGCGQWPAKDMFAIVIVVAAFATVTIVGSHDCLEDSTPFRPLFADVNLETIHDQKLELAPEVLSDESSLRGCEWRDGDFASFHPGRRWSWAVLLWLHICIPRWPARVDVVRAIGIKAGLGLALTFKQQLLERTIDDQANDLTGACGDRFLLEQSNLVRIFLAKGEDVAHVAWNV